MTTERPGPLAHLRVLEVGTGVALAYCGKLFADFAARCPVLRPAPTLGEDNQAVLADLLGLTTAEIDRLAAACVIGNEAVPVSRRRSRMTSLSAMLRASPRYR